MMLKKIGDRPQRTIGNLAEVQGIGFVTGADVHLQFQPAPADTGIVFLRTDLNPPARIPARLDQVTGTQRRTTLGHPPRQIMLVEHVLAALAGLRIDNCLVLVDAPEPPGLDGSALGFVEALLQAGIVRQSAPRPIWTVEQLVSVQSDGASLAIAPAAQDDEFRISYLLDFGVHSPIGRQSHTESITPASFASAIADSRTFVLEYEALELRRQGYGKRVTTADLLVIGPQGMPIGNRLRHGDELARHKILDIVGDLSLQGGDLRGHMAAFRSGHQLNIQLVKELTGTACGSGRQAA
jgi:UDP-3-O-acyl N-acetylglucosamine deacetylase